MNSVQRAAGGRRYAIVEAPSILGLKPTGVELLPARLLANGFAEQIQARRAARVETPEYDARRDPRTGTLNAQAIAEWSLRLADAVESVLSEGEFPVVLGGGALRQNSVIKLNASAGAARRPCWPSDLPIFL